MPSFTQRSDKKELLDRDDIPFEDIKTNMQELDLINKKLGGHRITIEGFKNFIQQRDHREITVAEIGCGGGDNLRAIKIWAKKKNISVRLIGIDINKECISYAKQQEENKGIDFVHSDYAIFSFEKKPDIIFSSLFCHHFTNSELVAMIKWMEQHSILGFFINDLHRHPLAWWSIKILTKIFSRSYLVKNDAPISVERGFKKEDWRNIFQSAQIKDYSCQWKWAFRWLVIYRHGKK